MKWLGIATAAREIEGLPAPVQRYFRAVLTDGQAIVSAVVLLFMERATGRKMNTFQVERLNHLQDCVPAFWRLMRRLARERMLRASTSSENAIAA